MTSTNSTRAEDNTASQVFGAGVTEALYAFYALAAFAAAVGVLLIDDVDRGLRRGGGLPLNREGQAGLSAGAVEEAKATELPPTAQRHATHGAVRVASAPASMLPSAG